MHHALALLVVAMPQIPSCMLRMQIALLLPFMRCGEFILRAPQLPLTRVSIKDVFLHHQGPRYSAGPAAMPCTFGLTESQATCVCR